MKCTTTEVDGKYTIAGTFTVTVAFLNPLSTHGGLTEESFTIKIFHRDKVDEVFGSCSGCEVTTQLSVAVNKPIVLKLTIPKIPLNIDLLTIAGFKIVDISFDGTVSFQGTITYTIYDCSAATLPPAPTPPPTKKNAGQKNLKK